MGKAYKTKGSALGFSNENIRDALRSFVWLSGQCYKLKNPTKKAKNLKVDEGKKRSSAHLKKTKTYLASHQLIMQLIMQHDNFLFDINHTHAF